MKKIMIVFAIALVLLVSCKNQTKNNQSDSTSVEKDTSNLLAAKNAFNDTLNGKQVVLFYLKNNGMQAAITNYGGRIVNLIVPDKNGKQTDVIIGPGNYKDLYHTKDFFGAIIGRYGNRIANGKFMLDEKQYILPQNNGNNTLHGGPDGFYNVMWDGEQASDSSLQLTYFSKDGEMGFPGNMDVKVTYTITTDHALKIEYEATTDKKTVCNLTNHAYFNLNGSGTINNHTLMINADAYTPVDSTLIPFGKHELVDNTPFDFRKATTIGARVNDKNTQLQYGLGYDHNFVINDSGYRKAAEVIGDKSGIIMQIFSEEPGLQFYSGNFMKGEKPMKQNTKDEYRTAFCLETQHFPDAPNQPAFPSTILNKGEVYKTVTVYQFSAKK